MVRLAPRGGADANWPLGESLVKTAGRREIKAEASFWIGLDFRKGDCAGPGEGEVAFCFPFLEVLGGFEVVPAGLGTATDLRFFGGGWIVGDEA